jgi:hypothetical protein
VQIFLRASPSAKPAPMSNDRYVRIGIFLDAEIGEWVGLKGVSRRVNPCRPTFDVQLIENVMPPVG